MMFDKFLNYFRKVKNTSLYATDTFRFNFNQFSVYYSGVVKGCSVEIWWGERNIYITGESEFERFLQKVEEIRKTYLEINGPKEQVTHEKVV